MKDHYLILIPLPANMVCGLAQDERQCYDYDFSPQAFRMITEGNVNPDLNTSLYSVIFSKEMRSSNPETDKINSLNLSPMSKCILYLHTLEVCITEIAAILVSNQHSIQTMIAKIRKRHQDILI